MNMFTPSRRRALTFAVLAACRRGDAAGVFAQIPSSGPTITWLVGQPPGGTTDVLTRLVGRQVEQILRQPVVVENRPGAAGALALQAAARAPKDGHTLVTVPGPVLSANPTPQLGNELTGVALLAKGPVVLVGTMAYPMPNTLQALLAAAQKDPKAFSFGSSGNGTNQHLAGELMNQMAHTQITHVPYKGGAQAVTDLVGGQIQLAILGITPVLQHIKAGKLRAYAVSTATRSPLLPDVPTFSEAGLKGFGADQWFAVATTAGVPAERVQALNAAIEKALQSPEVQAAFSNAGVTPASATPQQATDFVTGDLARWLAIAKQAKLPLE